MSERISHPVWTRPSEIELEGILGDCLASPVSGINVTAEADTLSDPTLVSEITCARFPEGITIETPFPLMDTADTNSEQIQLGVDTVKIALDSLCSTCTLRSCIG